VAATAVAATSGVAATVVALHGRLEYPAKAANVCLEVKRQILPLTHN
jgi:alpha-beta hydrolase superfamily lysophospholipase